VAAGVHLADSAGVNVAHRLEIRVLVAWVDRVLQGTRHETLVIGAVDIAPVLDVHARLEVVLPTA